MEEKIIETALQVTPAGLAGYTLTVLVLITVAAIFYKKWCAADDYIKTLTKESMEGWKETTESYIRTQEQINNKLANNEARLKP